MKIYLRHVKFDGRPNQVTAVGYHAIVYSVSEAEHAYDHAKARNHSCLYLHVPNDKLLFQLDYLLNIYKGA